MRTDMPKLLVERPRKGGGAPFPRPQLALGDPRVQDRLPACEGMEAAWKKHSKYFNENLAPLRRFLERAVGRPWDDVYSEIREHLHADSTIHQHILIHLRDFVNEHVVERDGRLFHTQGYWCGRELEARRRPIYYVCPRTRKLAQVLPRRQPASEDAPDRVRLGPHRIARKLEGQWYGVELASLPREGGVWDCLLRRVVFAGDAAHLRERHGEPAYARTKAQLSRRAVERDVEPALARRT